MNDISISHELHRRLSAIEEGTLAEVEALLRDMQAGDLGIRTKSNALDLVTRADTESEQRLLDLITREFPEDGILAEESAPGAGLDSRNADQRARNTTQPAFVWVIDPVDGTVNYAHGLPLYSVSIGILYDGRPAAGLVTMPALGTRYRAVRGSAATKDGRPIAVSTTSELKRGLVATGFPYNREPLIDALVTGVRQILLNARGLRRTGSAALDLCWLAEGHFDAYFEWNLKSWDTCAGVAILNAAGGRASDFHGNEHVPGDFQTLATNGILHDQALAMLAPIRDVQKPPE